MSPRHTMKRTLRVAAAIACLGFVSATAPQQISIQIVDQRGVPVRDAVVEIARPAGNRQSVTFPWRNAMGQRNLTFVPGTLIVPAGASVAFPNLDNVRHSIYSFSKNARFQIDLYGRDQTRTQTFTVPGTVALGCNIHDQMKAYVRVVNTPFAARSDTNGFGRIGGLGAGTYQVTVWHPRLKGKDGELRQTLKVAADRPGKLQIELR